MERRPEAEKPSKIGPFFNLGLLHNLWAIGERTYVAPNARHHRMKSGLTCSSLGKLTRRSVD